MSKDCFFQKFKKISNNSGLNYFGYFKMFIDTTGAVGNTAFAGYGNLAGVKILSGGTFTDGTTEDATGKYIAPNSVLTILCPKYDFLPYPITSNGSVSPSTTPISYNKYNANDVKKSGITYPQNQTQIVYRGTQDPDVPNITGDITKLLAKYQSAYITKVAFGRSIDGIAYNAAGNCDIRDVINALPNLTELTFTGSNWSGSISGVLQDKPNVSTLALAASKVTGDLKAEFSAMCQANKSAVKARTNSLTVATNNYMINSFAKNTTIKFNFSGGATVTVTNPGGTTTYATYNIDTDTWT